MPRSRPPRPISLLANLLLILQFHVHSVTSACSEDLALSGWPPCANACFSICDKYCPSAILDPVCTCTTPAYTRETYDCLRESCSDADTQYIYGTSAQFCASYGHDISSHLNATSTESSSLPSSTSTSRAGTTSAAASDGNGDKGGGGKKGVPVATVVGIALGLGLALLAGAALATWFCIRRRKKQKAAVPEGVAAHTPVVEQTVYVEPPKQNMQQPPQHPNMYPGPPGVGGVGPNPAVQNWGIDPRQSELYGVPVNNSASPPPVYRTEVEGNTPQNAPGWRPPHELGS